MTLLEAVEAVADEVGYQIDTTVIGSTDPMTVKLLAVANRVVGEMCERYAWSKLFREHTFDLATGVATYALPSDFSHYHYDSWWNATRRWKLFGPMSPQEEAAVAGYGLDPTIEQRFQLRGVTDKRIVISPTPTASENGDDIIFRYLSRRYVRPLQWAQGLTITAGDYIFNKGNYYTASGSGTTGGTEITGTSSTPTTDGGVNWVYYAGAYEKFLADTDVPILSQRILEQGMIERVAERQAVGAASRYEQQLELERAKDMPAKVLYAGGQPEGLVVSAYNGTVNFGRIR